MAGYLCKITVKPANVVIVGNHEDMRALASVLEMLVAELDEQRELEPSLQKMVVIDVAKFPSITFPTEAQEYPPGATTGVTQPID